MHGLSPAATYLFQTRGYTLYHAYACYTDEPSSHIPISDQGVHDPGLERRAATLRGICGSSGLALALPLSWSRPLHVFCFLRERRVARDCGDMRVLKRFRVHCAGPSLFVSEDALESPMHIFTCLYMLP